MRTAPILGVAAAVLLSSTGCSPQRLEPVTPESACTDPELAAEARPWRRVQGPGFTYCVPPHWYPGDGESYATARVWRNGNDSIQWNAGAPIRALPVESSGLTPIRTEAVVTRPGSLPPPMSMGTEAEHCGAGTPGIEAIGGRRAEVTSRACGRQHRTTAYWRQLNFHFAGLAASAAASHTQLTVYRTVRFAAAVAP